MVFGIFCPGDTTNVSSKGQRGPLRGPPLAFFAPCGALLRGLVTAAHRAGGRGPERLFDSSESKTVDFESFLHKFCQKC